MRIASIAVALFPVCVLAQVLSADSAVGPNGVSSTAITAPRFDIAAQDWEYYVDSAGNDSNTCLSAASPCLTVAGVMAKVPDAWKQKARVHFTAGTFAMPDHISVGLGGEPLVLMGTMIDSGLGELTVTAVTTQSHWGQDRVIAVTDSSQSPTLDQYEGYIIRFTSGAAIGKRKMLRGNTTGGSFEFNVMIYDHVAIPAIGDTFVIEKPGTILQTSTSSVFNATSKGRGGKGEATIQLGLYDIQLDHAGASGEGYFKFDGINVRTINVWFTGNASGSTGIQVANGGTLWAGGTDATYQGDILSDGLFSIWDPDSMGLGMFVQKATCSTGGILAIDGAVVSGYFVGRNSKLWANNAMLRTIANLSWRGCRIDLEAGSGILLYNFYAPTGRIDAASSYGIQFNILSWGQLSGPVAITSCSPGISITNSSYVYMTNMSGTNTTYGVSVDEFSRVSLGAGNTITGSSGDIAVAGNVTTIADVYTNDIPFLGGSGGFAMKNTSTALPRSLFGATTIGTGGTEIDASIRCTATLDTNLIASGTTVSQSVSCAGAAVGAECSVGGPTTLEAGLSQSCVVSAADTIDLRTANVTAGGITPAGSQTVSVRVWNP